jgi:hypothetical protein
MIKRTLIKAVKTPLKNKINKMVPYLKENAETSKKFKLLPPNGIT